MNVDNTALSSLTNLRRKRKFQSEKPSGADVNLLKKLWAKEVGIEEVCICCHSHNPDRSHPIFEGGACNSCYEKLEGALFPVEEGTHLFCCICGESNTNYVICKVLECNRLYCKTCLEHLCHSHSYSIIKRKTNWKCFLCDSIQSRSSLLIGRKNWKNNIKNLTMKNGYPMKITAQSEKRPIRILSLFDGIGTGLVCLNKLKFSIGVYYASEIDDDAITVARVNNQGQVIHIGSVEKIDETFLREIGPIDLLLGGSPCNDLTLCNPKRKGIYNVSGTGILFFHFFRIKSLLQRIHGCANFFLFENTAAMPSKVRSLITRFLGVSPILVDAVEFTPQKRPRLFWHNLPNIENSHEREVVFMHRHPLSKFLTPFCDRVANVSQIRTITTNSNSLLQGLQMIPPVSINGTEDTLWITEIEEIFGFPRHYTDTGNLSLTKRLRVLGKSWCVPVVCHILQPLSKYFKTN